MKANTYAPDPIQNRRMSDACWNGKHFGMFVMTKDKDGVIKKFDIGCHGYLDEQGDKSDVIRCECLCHDPRTAARRKIKRKEQAGKTTNIMDTGCGTIEVK